MRALYKFSALLSSSECLIHANVTMYKGGCLYSVCPLEIWNYQIYNKFLSNSIKTIKCLPIYNTIQMRFFINGFIKEWCNNFQGISKFGAGIVQLFFCLHALAHLVRCGCSCIILLGSKDFMRSCPWAPAQSAHVSVSLPLFPSWHLPLGDFSISPGIQNTSSSWFFCLPFYLVCTPSKASVQLEIVSAIESLVP